jgi:hypothetical protein
MFFSGLSGLSVVPGRGERIMSPRIRTPRNDAIAAAIEAREWDRLTVSLALALVRLLETLPPNMAPELLALLAGDDEANNVR